MRRPRLRTVLTLVTVAAVTLLMLAAGTRYGRALFASFEGFEPLTDEPRVFAESGSTEMARFLADALPEAIATVERLHGAPFKKEIRVYACASQERFNRHVPLGLSAGGAVFLDRVFISPKAFAIHAAEPILKHELSHLHMRQYLGAIDFHSKLPGWFQEGLAVAVSDGGGAVQVDAATAREAIRAGRTFEPEDEGTWLAPQSAKAHGLQHHMFYRQSGLFVQYLMERDAVSFGRFMDRLRSDQSFRDAFEALGGSVAELWTAFRLSLDPQAREF
jgi:hypothetical protein